MISDYMEDLEIENPFSHLKPWQKTPYEKQHGRNIYKNNQGKYYIEKVQNKKRTVYGTYDTFQEALEARDELIRNGWVQSETIQAKQKQKQYYQNVYLNTRHYTIHKKDNFYGSTDTIEKALYYRDICKQHNWKYNKKPAELDLITNNPYLNDGLKYPVPERLELPVEKPKDKGYITRHSAQSNQVRLGHTYYGAYPTYEMAWYVLQKLRECDWDKEQLEKIVEEYPVWYTWLMNFWKFIIRDGDAWLVSLTPTNTGYEKLERIRFRKVEDALWERDLLIKYDFNEELLVECADDEKNPYYDMSLPPYPERKVRNLSERKDRTDLFNALFTLIQEEPELSQEEYCKLVSTTSASLRNVLRNEFDSDWAEFKTICESGENPNDVLVQKPKIYMPDLEIKYENTNYVSYHKREKSPYLIYHRNKVTQQSEYFGAYPTRELADKISNDLQKVGWDKSKLKAIQAKYGWKSVVNSKRWVYSKEYTSKKTGETYVSHYYVRKKNIGYFGTYKDKRVAELVRDLLILVDWNKDFLQTIREFSFYCISQLDHNWRCQLKWLGK